MRDGDVNAYVDYKHVSEKHLSERDSVIFVNGMLNSPQGHVDNAVALSALQMCKVIGVYNASRVGKWERTLRAASHNVSVIFEDLAQCLGDKITWDSHNLDRAAVSLNTWYQSHFGSPQEAEKYVELWLERNRASLALFRLLRAGSGPQTIFAHSQGNLITSNALTGLSLLDPSCLGRITVNSYASPSVFWPSGFKHNRYAYTLDPVPLLAGIGNSLKWSTSTIGGPSGIVSHGFANYIRDDATFIVNQFRVGMLGMTAHMDERGLARALFDMGSNLQRVRKVFARLSQTHQSDVDDVALLYVESIRNRQDLLVAVKNYRPLKDILIRSLATGWTSNREKAAIKLIS
ncbi:hypothetical protein [Tropicimonas sp. S265A]|uniref:hypothetical protein n=1 Tax=Tropicimonas sp. S265A TaxID=3415134 RepID=UPI003C7A9704